MMTIGIAGLILTLLLAWRKLGWKFTLGLFCLAVVIALVALVVASMQPEIIRNWIAPVV